MRNQLFNIIRLKYFNCDSLGGVIMFKKTLLNQDVKVYVGKDVKSALAYEERPRNTWYSDFRTFVTDGQLWESQIHSGKAMTLTMTRKGSGMNGSLEMHRLYYTRYMMQSITTPVMSYT